jgi:hypothetical protein
MHSSVKDEIKDVNFNFMISSSIQYPCLLIFAAVQKKIIQAAVATMSTLLECHKT